MVKYLASRAWDALQSYLKKLKRLDTSITEAEEGIEIKEREIADLKKDLDRSSGDIAIGTRQVYCEGCKGYHTITDIPGTYDLCIVRGLLGLEYKDYSVRLDKDGNLHPIVKSIH